MPVLISSELTGPPPVSIDYLRACGERLLRLCGREKGELSILLVSDSRIAELNSRYRKKQKPTNVLAFAMQEGPETQDYDLLGDIVISVETAAREARLENISIHRRIAALLIHGLLHLLGLDHEKSDEEAAAMKSEEEILLEKLIIEQRRGGMVKLAVNVDHVATLREARGINEPDPVQAAAICELAGAQGIVVHLREDRRHIQDRDVRLLRQTVKTKLNLEMGATEEIIGIALDLKPDMVTFVPEKRKELTTEGGLNVIRQKKKIKKAISKMTKADIPVSLFIDPDSGQIKASKEVGATFVEIHTGTYCDAVTEVERDREFDLIASAAEEAFEAGLRVNAGHGLNYLTTQRVAQLGTIEELSIGHAIMARAILVGLDQAVREMAALVQL
ncbi:MAG: pyridoxine 5'-phosphate synthase [Desulfobulbaceae bacterium]|nr:pyridoxine 5'-phosphate synthase [Desulfobulbaceae bacterium]MCK5436383.1 pyridoxine 5'-phosphate synthase [Desulfobulbaceae bacterium]MCK5543682.1 pyridoxine 5'-phosphate synthase [Desulfobulbaceae bacterium]